MNKLRELRTQIGMTQRDLAEKLGTTQQTVARWETGSTAIPVSQLKDLAVFFGCSVDELLGVELRPKLRKAAAFARTENATPWGTLCVDLPSGARGYPVDEREVERLTKKLMNEEPSSTKGWLEFSALDNRLVLLNTEFVRVLDFVSDDTEAMPYFASPETYQSLTRGTPVEELGPLVLEQRAELIRRLSGPEAQERLRHDSENTEFVVDMEMQWLKLVYPDGRTDSCYLSDWTASSVLGLSLDSDEIAPNTFFLAEQEGDRKFVNLSKLAAIEVPLERYLELMDDEAGTGD